MMTTFEKMLICTFLYWLLNEFGCLPVNADPFMHKLYNDIMARYEKDIRPSKNYSHTLNVTFAFSLAQIIDVDEKNQILTSNAWLYENWIDYKLQWNPIEYNNIKKIHIPHDKVWLPDIVLYNNADSNYNTAIVSTDVFVQYNGNVTWLLGAIFKSSCEMNVRYYPFDDQICLMKFASWSYDGSYINLLASDKGDETNYMPSTEWDLTYMKIKKNIVFYSCCPDEPYPDVTVTLGLRRKPMFYIFNLIYPSILITGMALLGFYMPSDSGEKITLGITTVLSMTVFLLLVAETMPPTSHSLPLIGVYYIVMMSLVSFATLLTVCTLNIHHKGEWGSPVPLKLKIFAFKYIAPLLRVKIDPPEEFVISQQQVYSSLKNDANCCCGVENGLPVRAVISENGLKSHSINVEYKMDDQFAQVLEKVYSIIDKNEARQEKEEKTSAVNVEWQQLAQILDRFLLVVFAVITTTSTLVIMYQQHLWN